MRPKADICFSLFEDKLINGMTTRGYEPEFAEKAFSQIEGFGSYGLLRDRLSLRVHQRESPVIHIIAQRLNDLSAMLARVGSRGGIADIYRASRTDVVKRCTGSDPRDPAERGARDIFIPDLRLGSGIIPGGPT